MTRGNPILRQLRYTTTRESTLVRDSMAWMITQPLADPIRHRRLDGLPTWWAFWEDGLVGQTRTLVRQARALEAYEATLERRPDRLAE